MKPNNRLKVPFFEKNRIGISKISFVDGVGMSMLLIFNSNEFNKGRTSSSWCVLYIIAYIAEVAGIVG